MKKLISFIIRAEKGFFKKPDINDEIYLTYYLTYNMIHKPAILGILGAIIGLKGYQKEGILPEYYRELSNIFIGIKPVDSNKGVFQKTLITYTNTTNFANKGGNLIITEQTLIKPSYKIYLYINMERDIEKKLYEYIIKQKAEYLPYMGKNDYSLWWNKEEVVEYEGLEKFDRLNNFYIETIFKKEEAIVHYIAKGIGRKAIFEEKNYFYYFEKIPIALDENLFQYEMANFVYTNAKLTTEVKINSNNLFKIKGENKVIFLY